MPERLGSYGASVAMKLSACCKASSTNRRPVTDECACLFRQEDRFDRHRESASVGHVQDPEEGYLDVDQQPVQEGPMALRAKCCHDCAYRMGSPERERGEYDECGGLSDIAGGARSIFHCAYVFEGDLAATWAKPCAVLAFSKARKV